MGIIKTWRDGPSEGKCEKAQTEEETDLKLWDDRLRIETFI